MRKRSTEVRECCRATYKNITTTQIYADVLDKNKRATVDLLDE
jgi:hypothetical protein